MKCIGLTQRLESFHGGREVREALDINWAPFLEACELHPRPLPLLGRATDLLEGLAGLVLTGGHTPSVVHEDALARRRDEFESRLLAAAALKGLPVLGVCRGCQFLNVEAGGALVAVSGHVNNSHELSISGTPAVSLRTQVNSYHDWGIADLGAGLVALANAADGTVEAFQDVRRRWLGIMWHPERDLQPVAEDIALFRNWFGV